MPDLSAYRTMVQNMGLKKPDAYTPYAAGMKLYGGGRSNPTSGPVDKEGYREREMLNRAKRNATLQMLQKYGQGRAPGTNPRA